MTRLILFAVLPPGLLGTAAAGYEWEIELSGALIEIETAADDVVRGHSLPDLRVQPEESAALIWKCADCDTNNARTDAECIACGRARPVSRVRKNLPALTNSGRKAAP
ncbi:hypothetical protein ACIP80_32825 [Streptomyces sp. NPDC088555]|uniref:hypothetical protein n=1 Tax=Streptomyces sp. NPDC088555 TaxID=3365866 RepID=UPI003817F31A